MIVAINIRVFNALLLVLVLLGLPNLSRNLGVHEYPLRLQVEVVHVQLVDVDVDAGLAHRVLVLFVSE